MKGGDHEDKKRSAPYSPDMSPRPLKKITRSFHEVAEKKSTQLEAILEEERNFAKASPGSLVHWRKIVARRPVREEGANISTAKNQSTAKQSTVAELPDILSPKQFNVSLFRQKDPSRKGDKEWIDRSSGVLTLSSSTGHLTVFCPDTNRHILNATVPIVSNPINVTITATESVPDLTLITILDDASGVAVGRRPFALKFESYKKCMLFLGVFNAASIRKKKQNTEGVSSTSSSSTTSGCGAHELKKNTLDESLDGSINDEDEDFYPASQDIFEDARNLADKMILKANEKE
jgi:hypothetical protein